jgi:bifunctional oligoribonuclease and PAP phosphatase NrnA
MAYYPENATHWARIGQLVEGAGRIFLSTHVNPDGDAIGSVMALAGMLGGMGKPYRVILQSVMPETYRFLDPEGRIESYPENPPVGDGPGERDLVFFLDVGRLDRTGNVERFLADNPARKIIIDHHRPETVEADLIVVNPRAESTGSLVYDLITTIAPFPVTERIALATLTAIVTDTGYFRYSNTNEITHRVAASLYEHGARVGFIRRELETGQPFCRQKLLGLMLAGLRQAAGGRIAYSFITADMFEETGARREHTDGIIDHIRIIQNTRIASLIVQEGPYLFKASFRTTDSVPANDIASLLGGGGHPRAAGATLSGNLEQVISLVLEAAETILDDGKE